MEKQQMAVFEANECTDALIVAVEAMQPPIDVYRGILRLIAEFVPYGTFLHIICIVS